MFRFVKMDYNPDLVLTLARAVVLIFGWLGVRGDARTRFRSLESPYGLGSFDFLLE